MYFLPRNTNKNKRLWSNLAASSQRTRRRSRGQSLYRTGLIVCGAFRWIVQLGVAALLLGGASQSVFAQADEETGRKVAEELRVLVSEGTGVIGELQPAINGSKTSKDQVAPDALVEQFKMRYQKATGSVLDLKAAGLIGDTRRAYVQAFTTVVTRFQPNLTKGGQDAFVPAFFRAQSLNVFNKSMQGKLQA